MNEAPRLLFITLSNIGDAVMTTPVLATLHRLFPTAKIDIVADARSAALFEPCPFRGDILLKNKNEGLRGIVALVRKLRQRRYAAIVDLRTDGLSWLLCADQRYTKRHAGKPAGHAVERAYAVISTLTHDSPPPTQLWLRERDRSAARARADTLPPGKWLAIAPGANWQPKTWPIEYFQELLPRLKYHFNGLILVGSAQDKSLCLALEKTSPVPAINAAGETNLLEAAALIEMATLFIGNDSGLGHIAAAVGTPTLTLFGPGDSARYHPWGVNVRWLVAEDKNIASLTPARVAAEAEDMLVALKRRE
ncbi:MAG: glycosyltransferase family 9 protein [Gammaproteobacteria bacterium]